MNEYAVLVVMVVSVAADVRTLISKQHLLVRTPCQTLREYAARETGSYNQIIKHGQFPPCL